MNRRKLHTQAGFTYVGLIVFVTIIGLVGAATLKVGALLQRAEAENELLETGAVFSAALASYAQATPPGQPSQPASLEALLRDPRFPVPLRHLRRIFVDPITGSAEWGLVRAAEGGPILGVYSLSQAKPLKIANFDARFVNFDHKPHLSDWKFMADADAGHRSDRAADRAAPAAAAIRAGTGRGGRGKGNGIGKRGRGGTGTAAGHDRAAAGSCSPGRLGLTWRGA